MTDTRYLIEKYGIRANKNFGQNFLCKEDIIELIADSAKGTDEAVEIGIGLGVLTKSLCDRFKKVTTIEIDRSLSEVTNETLKDVTNHTLIYQNFLKTDLKDFAKKPITIVGNLPYNITGEIITKLLKNHSVIEKAVIMVQKEAAQKLAAGPADENYRAISVLTNYFCDIETVCDVSPDSFIPPPHVTSRVITLKFKKDLPIPADKEKDFHIFVHNIFSKRRKLLTAAFDKDKKEKVRNALVSLGFSDKIRGEQLTFSDLAKLYILTFCE